ncbi:hypothetical protein GTV32_09840 [Gordonia sp. SID5947]|uniref:WXG100-like domain-containing protein n=1 Tax=Gordonia sp. SID5947 TaxID=2690315 RepID=UPI00136F21A0|nr:hypothetical protein [Gordonia sp. SID5947]MYR06593.1 hypothetical protein [Gordonia sp. SID5947]
MGMELPGELTWPLSLTGMTWPEGDETALARMSEYWGDYADELTSVASELQSAAVLVLDSIEGDTHQALKTNLDEFFNGEKSLYEVIDDAEYLAQGAQKASDIVLAMKISFIVELMSLLAFIAVALASAFINWAAAAEISMRAMLSRVIMLGVRESAKRAMAAALQRILQNLSGTAALELLGGTSARAILAELTKSVTTGAAVSVGLEAERQLVKNAIAGSDYDPGKIGLAGFTGGAATLLFAKWATPTKAVTGWGMASTTTKYGEFANAALSGATWWVPATYAGNHIGQSVQKRSDPATVDQGVGIWKDLDVSDDPAPPVVWYPADRQGLTPEATRSGEHHAATAAPNTQHAETAPAPPDKVLKEGAP